MIAMRSSDSSTQQFLPQSGAAVAARELGAHEGFGQDKSDAGLAPGDGGIDQLPSDESALCLG